MTITEEINRYFGGSAYRYFVFTRTYARFLDDKGRRETWVEVVDRYMKFMKENLGKKLSAKEYDEVRDYILEQKAMPSMRLLWAAGDAARKNNAAAYNCSYVALDNIKRFREMLFLLCSGCGVGFSVEKKYVDELPVIEKQTGNKLPVFVIDDSREGWADALHHGVSNWYDGNDVEFDFSKIRPFGTRLKTMGGRASGSGPLKELLVFARNTILNAQGRRLRPIEVHDIATKIGEIVVAGGTRRSAMIGLSDLHDEEMRLAKSGNWHDRASHRRMANNSAVYEVPPSQKEFMKEWLALMESGSGERGIFNRHGVIENLPERRKELAYHNGFGCNPCGEIILRSAQFCNLTSVVCRPEDTLKSLQKKVKIATIIGTYQSSLTEFPYLTKIWADNCADERLLGVSLNGQFDCPEVRKEITLRKLREYAVEVNQEYAKKMGIKQSAAVTCVKPEGTGSQMLGCSSGAHPRYAKYYIRRIRISANDPLFKLMRDSGVEVKPEVGQSERDANTFVLSFPVKSPDGAITRNDITAIEQLEHWKKLKTNYAEHTVSTTVYIGKDEWVGVADWLIKNWSYVSGLSFLPKEDDEHTYELAPYEEITEERYNELASKTPSVDFGTLSKYEQDDETGGGGAGCESNVCLIDDLPIIT